MKKLPILLTILALGWGSAAQAGNDKVAPGGDGSRFKVASSAYKEGYYGVAMRRWMSLAEAGNGSAQYNIGLMHFYGQNVGKDMVEAYKWFLLADRNGIEKGKVAMDRMAYRMSPLQIAEAVRRAKEWQESRAN